MVFWFLIRWGLQAVGEFFCLEKNTVRYLSKMEFFEPSFVIVGFHMFAWAESYQIVVELVKMLVSSPLVQLVQWLEDVELCHVKI